MTTIWYSGNHGGLKIPDICLIGEEKPRKTSPRKLFPTGDRTRVRWVTGAHATASSIAVDVCIIVSLEHVMPSENEHNNWTAYTVGKHAVLLRCMKHNSRCPALLDVSVVESARITFLFCSGSETARPGYRKRWFPRDLWKYQGFTEWHFIYPEVLNGK